MNLQNSESSSCKPHAEALGGLWRWESVLTLGTEGAPGELIKVKTRLWESDSAGLGLGPAACIFNIYPKIVMLVLEPYFEKCIDNKDHSA